MPTNAELRRLAETHLYGNYRQAPFVLERGLGCEVWDVEGRRFLDVCSGVAVCAVGHAHPRHVEAIAKQAGTLMHVSNWFYNRTNIELAGRLAALTGLDRLLFCNSGAEAIEGLLKLSRHHFWGKGDTKRTRILAFDHAFHGRTMGALSLTGTPKYREGFGGLEGVTHLPYGDLDAVAKAMNAEVAAIFVEPIQGEGGVLPAPPGFLEGLRELCDKHGALLMLDEVQTGVGRTGAWFAFQHTGVKPDGIAMAKGLGGGFPIGAFAVAEALAGALPPGTHGTTYGGNSLGCASALAVLDILEGEQLVAGAKAKGEFLSKALADIVKEFPKVCEGERGVGLLRGLVLREGFVARDVVPRIFEKGVLVIGAGDRVLRFCPALVITEAQLAEAVAAVRAVIAELAA
jgi:acetylornithine/N-succinyldiaminopimelate aminotransferase